MYSPQLLAAEGAVRKNAIVSLPPPVGGLNASSTLASMPVKDAVVCENWVPYPDRLEMRFGAADHTTGFGAPVKSLHAWNGPSTASLWATTDSGVYNATSAGAVGAAAIALTNGVTQGAILSTGASHYLTLVNGTDSAVQYNGTAWSSIATFGTLNSNTIIGIETYKQRYYFIEENSLNLHFLAVNSISGASTSYNLGSYFRRGGNLVGIATWTIDAGAGPDDHLVIASSQGEVVVFTGTDPASPTAWFLKGVYYVGVPLGNKCLYKYAGDVLLLSETGIYPLSKALLTASVDRARSLSEKIRPLFNSYVSQYRASVGWELLSHPDVPFLLVNIPGTSMGTQLVMHSQTGAWTTFSGWAANCWARFNNEIYYGTTSKTVKAWTGSADFGANIIASVLQGYSSLGSSRQKQVTMMRPMFTASGEFSYTIGLAQDFLNDPTTNLIQASAGAASLWGTGVWGTAVWSGTEALTRDWRVVHDRPSYYKALYLQVASKSTRVSLQNVDLLVSKQGTF